MKFIADTTWEEVFNGWKERESTNHGWIECATKIKGWPDWESWRRFTAKQINAESRKWRIFEFEDPINEIPNLLLGPYSGWQSRTAKKNDTTFEELISIPEQAEHFSGHSGVISILSGLPFSTELIGIVRGDNNKTVCLDGHHRAVAMALAKIQNKSIDFHKTRITIALTVLTADECTILDDILERGTSKNS